MMRLALIGTFTGGDLLNQVDDRATEFGIGDSGEGPGQGKSFRGCKEV
jgi:hypothetical protein